MAAEPDEAEIINEMIKGVNAAIDTTLKRKGFGIIWPFRCNVISLLVPEVFGSASDVVRTDYEHKSRIIFQLPECDPVRQSGQNPLLLRCTIVHPIRPRFANLITAPNIRF